MTPRKGRQRGGGRPSRRSRFRYILIINQQPGKNDLNVSMFQHNIPYPKSVFLILGNEFCERLSYYGMKSILSIYINQKLHFDHDRSTTIYHTFTMLCYFCPMFGAMIADQFLGKFKTIVYISIIYVLGHLLKTLAAVPTLGVPPV